MKHEKVREIDTERFGEKILLSVFRFSRDELPFTKVKGARGFDIGIRNRKIIERNTEHYARWVISLMEEQVAENSKEEIGTMKKYSVFAFFMNSHNERWLSEHIFPMDFLNWGPVTLDALRNDEYALDMARLTTEAHNE